MITLLLAATITVTTVYAATLARDIGRHHWAEALDASREAVLAVVGWAAVMIVLSAQDAQQPEQARPGDGSTGGGSTGGGSTGGEGQDEPAAAGPVLQAQDRVRRLRGRLAELVAARDRAGKGADPDLDRELASTTARLEQARQWLTSAQSARSAVRAEPRPARRQAERLAPRQAGSRSRRPPLADTTAATPATAATQAAPAEETRVNAP